MKIDILSTRLFPRNQGAEAYKITGIAARCDWVILSDHRPPKIHVHRNVDTNRPRHIFLSLREPYRAISFFCTEVLPTLNNHFVLITGSKDQTLPNQTDVRFRKFSDHENGLMEDLLAHPFLVHWFAENLDDATHPKRSALPLGFVFRENQSATTTVPDVLPIQKRHKYILCGHRVRDGPQWDLRRHVTNLARTSWSQWCTVLDEEISEPEYLELVQQHKFVLCVEGGGLDPSPKAWQSILHGAIPVMRSTALRPAYQMLPVTFVRAWEENEITEAKIAKWVKYHDPSKPVAQTRLQTIERLGVNYWWNQIAAKVPSV